jgi:septal ring factor EnvC (AmiA/AmiB activator)
MAFEQCHNFAPRAAVLWVALVLCVTASAQGSKKSELEAERSAISARIAATQALLEDARSDQQRTTQELSLLKEELNLRQQLLSNLRKERWAAERRLDARKTSVEGADAQLDALKEEYAEMIRVAARLERGDALWGMLLDAESTAQAFRRLLLIEEYGRTRKQQAERIASSTASLREELNALRQERAALVGVETELRSARDEAKSGARRQESLLSELRTQERRLKDQLATEEARRAELGKAIDRLIAEANRSSSSEAGFAATPEGQIIGAEFQANKGKLPWPVAEGVITGRFGTHNHPTLPGIKIERRGVDIATSAGAAVSAVFSGRVSNVIGIPGGGMAVMVDHGSHRTVYANLSQVSVSDGQDIRTGQRIGTVLDLGTGHRAHFEVWDAGGSAPLNPELWIAR